MSDFLEPARVEGMQFYCDPPPPPVDISPETGMVAGEGEGNSATGQRGVRFAEEICRING